MPRVLVIGDMHFMPSTFVFTDKVTKEILEIVDNDPTITHIVHLGDILDKHGVINLQSQVRACRFLTELGNRRKTINLIGNHDIVNERVFLPEENCLSVYSHPNVTVVSKPIVDEDFVYVPYVPAGRFHEALECLEGVDFANKIIFAHQEFRGCDLGCRKSANGDEYIPTQIISGHIHKHHELPNVLYTGTPYNTDYGDLGEKGVWILDTKNGEIIERKKMTLKGVPIRAIIEDNWRNILTLLEGKEGKYTRVKYVYHTADKMDREFMNFKKTIKRLESQGRIEQGIGYEIREDTEMVKKIDKNPYEHIVEDLDGDLRQIFESILNERSLQRPLPRQSPREDETDEEQAEEEDESRKMSWNEFYEKYKKKPKNDDLKAFLGGNRMNKGGNKKDLLMRIYDSYYYHDFISRYRQ